MNSPRITKVKGKDYLDAQNTNVAFWDKFDSDYVRIETDIHLFNDEVAVVKATITILSTDGEIMYIANGLKQAWRSEFANHLEKAETGAVRRAMGFLGVNVGSLDADDASGGDRRFADSHHRVVSPNRGPEAPQRQGEARAKVDPEQVKGIENLFRSQKFTVAQVEKVLSRFGGAKKVSDLTKGQASALENQLMEGTVRIPE